ncbi:MAG: type II CAAX endopeptidase family protein, partial [Planctomycetota bacterium]
GQLALYEVGELSKTETDAIVEGTLAKFMLLALLMFVLIGLVLIGVVLGIVAIVLIAKGTIRPKMQRFSKPTAAFAEVLGIFLALFVLIQLGIGLLGIEEAAPIVIWLTLGAAFWPLVRGWSWKETCDGLGWTTGRGFFVEIGAGLVGYLALLPLVAIGLLATIVVTLIGAGLGLEPPTHPVAEGDPSSSITKILLLFLLASVWAPVVEETIFRGALFHHLHAAIGVAGAALISGFIFAVIHPQGVLGVPALTTIGVCFALLRYWRGSLIASVTAHAVHNTFLITLLVILTS